ncbi:hypothetical protein BD410DRAFT_902743, partial [Rickenella mellea]
MAAATVVLPTPPGPRMANLAGGLFNIRSTAVEIKTSLPNRNAGKGGGSRSNSDL